jgi:xanthine dehydrogenase iron-sulfur cluster and FAD-binding subunit A
MTAVASGLHWVQQPGSTPGGIIRPSTIEEAAHVLAANPELRLVAGGTDLLLELARDRQNGRVDLLDMTGIQGLGEIHHNPEGVLIGAGVTHADIVASTELSGDGVQALRQACLEIGSPQLRNRATLVGNLVTASPANDTISALMALDAELRTVIAADGELVWRTIKLIDFYSGFRSTVLAATELVTHINIPATEGTRRGVWVKAGLRKAQAISVVHAGLVLTFDDDGTIAKARIALGSVGPTVALNAAAAQVLVGTQLDQISITAAAQAAVDSISPIDDGRATAEYRRASVYTVISRGLSALAAGAEASRWPDRVPLLTTRADTRRDATGEQPRRRDIPAGSPVSVTVNGAIKVATPRGAGTLLDWLRDTAGPGTKEGCAEGECGACTVQLDGDAVMSCLVPAVQADGGTVTTIEGLAPAGAPNTMQQMFVDRFAVQCGYCIPGFVMAAQTLADELGSVPTRAEIELALSGNLCRCTGYYNIIDAVTAAIKSELL